MAKILSALETLPFIESIKRSRGRWRILAFVALAALLIVATMRISSDFASNDQIIARVIVSGTIFTDPARLSVLKNLEDNDAVKGVIININSPGGTTAGGEELYEALLSLSTEKPVVAVINELGASAAYMAAIGTDQIFARRLSLVGSIGVLVQHMNAGGLLETIGVDFDKVQSGPLKAEPDIDDALTGEVRASLQALVDDSFEWFVDSVAERRDMDRAAVMVLADGRIMTGRQAATNGLIDEFGGEREAQIWLEETHSIEPELPILTFYPFPLSGLEQFAGVLGGQAQNALGLQPGTIVPLDGLVSLWHATN